MLRLTGVSAMRLYSCECHQKSLRVFGVNFSVIWSNRHCSKREAVCMQDYNNVDNSMLELVFAPAAQWISRSDEDVIQGTP